jgi:hypothetical protein
MVENTTKKLVYDLITDFIWLTCGDIEKMIYAGGWKVKPQVLSISLGNLFREGKIVRRGVPKSYQYLMMPK